MTNKTFQLFNDIQHTPLRVYNRLVLMNNLMEDFGTAVVADYLSNFNEGERKQLYFMQQYVLEHGVDATRKLVTKGLHIVSDEDYVDEEA